MTYFESRPEIEPAQRGAFTHALNVVLVALATLSVGWVTPALGDSAAAATSSTIDGQYAGIGIRGAGSTTAVAVANRGGVPADAVAVVLNITAAQGSGTGYATVFACGTPRPVASNINFGGGTTIANSVISKIGADGTVCIYTDQTTHLIVDVNGYFRAGAGFGVLSPARLLDSRPAGSTIASGEEVSLTLLNQLRLGQGRTLVLLDPAMSDIARSWSQTMSLSGFRHSGGPYAENIAWEGSAGLSPEDAARAFHTAWVNSPPHYLNMINPSWTYVGIGLYRSESGWYATMVFR